MRLSSNRAVRKARDIHNDLKSEPVSVIDIPAQEQR
jgi:hypothetical protein